MISALSHYPSLFVIARNSTFTYKGRAVDVKQVGRELGVRYVLEGGVRKAGNRIRVTAQLIEAGTGNHVWAERYDRDAQNFFRQAIDLDPTFAPGYSALALAQLQSGRGIPEAQSCRSAKLSRSPGTPSGLARWRRCGGAFVSRLGASSARGA